VRAHYRDQGLAPEGQIDDDSFNEFITVTNLKGEMTYSCHNCGTSGSAFTGWDVKPPSSNKGWRWGCLVCGQNWARSTDMSVLVHLSANQLSLSFYTRWPLDDWVKENWPEVYHKANHWTVQRSTWYCKYDPEPSLRDAPATDNPKHRLKMAQDTQRQIWNIILPDGVFDSSPESLKASIQKENSRRWNAYGPGTHEQTQDEGFEKYKQVRVTGIADTDAPEYKTFRNNRKNARKQKKNDWSASTKAQGEWANWSMS
jgi:hypothetical protein